ncbi:MAG: diaminopimelate epimerase [Paludibacteraceae bacterium]|nr:diaminopimelate epimerase [Paludibacteraceae bacterium]
MRKELKFVKMHGLGNDYVYIDCFPATSAAIIASTDLSALARAVSDRHFGIGSDGLVLILPCKEAEASMRIFNADGSEAEMCGNAIRCVGKYLYESGLCTQLKMRIKTMAGIRELCLHVQNGLVHEVTVDMGTPKTATDSLALKGRDLLGFTSVNMGNPHAVFFRSWVISDAEMADLGERIGTHPHFPEDTNVEFVHVRNARELDVRVWERGSGETMACGTGACAAAVAAYRMGETEEEIIVHLKGGELLIHYDPLENRITMTGPATEVFRGTYSWEE